MTSFIEITENQFPLLKKHCGSEERFFSEIKKLNYAIINKSIYNQDYLRINQHIGNAIFKIFLDYVGEVYKTYDRNSIPKDILTIYDDICPTSLRSIPALKKRIDKCKSAHPLLTALQEMVSEIFPLVDIMTNLKGFIIKGRQPNTNTKSENPDKIVRTCPCCFRKIAIDTSGHMVNHGYKQSGNGYIVGNCFGVKFKPLEVSPDGVDFMINYYKTQYEKTKKNYDTRNQWTKLPYKPRYNSPIVEITLEHPQWENTKNIKIANIESELRYIERDLKTFQVIRKEWVAKEIEPIKKKKRVNK